jgi:hypothetical protein
VSVLLDAFIAALLVVTAAAKLGCARYRIALGVYAKSTELAILP